MRILITGGAGFIGTNIALYHLNRGDEVVCLDDLSRKGSERNLEFLTSRDKFYFISKDISEGIGAIQRPDIIYHMAAQVGVQKSIDDPIDDFSRNIVGTLNVLEYARSFVFPPIVIYASTNKVYGDLQVSKPVSEKTPLSFHTPYGCSKGAADQYMLDYYRIYQVPTIVFRQSCIYGYFQNGNEDQGWVAWFLKASHSGLPITIYGDGNQVRDVLWIEDLIEAYQMAIDNIEVTRGRAYNIGGGRSNVISLHDLIKYGNVKSPVTYADWRPADQKYYVSDISKAKKDFGWEPKTQAKKGILKLKEWIENA